MYFKRLRTRTLDLLANIPSLSQKGLKYAEGNYRIVNPTLSFPGFLMVRIQGMFYSISGEILKIHIEGDLFYYMLSPIGAKTIVHFLSDHSAYPCISVNDLSSKNMYWVNF